jgi:hypothetical protein
MLHHVALVGTDILKECIASIIGVTTNSMLPLIITANVPTSQILFTLMMEVIHSSETSVLTKVTQRNNREDSIFHGFDIVLHGGD